jgi:UTP-glucose-1-phosphate uridylyltransferase
LVNELVGRKIRVRLAKQNLDLQDTDDMTANVNGVVYGSWSSTNRILNIKGISEKPGLSYASKNLRVDDYRLERD